MENQSIVTVSLPTRVGSKGTPSSQEEIDFYNHFIKDTEGREPLEVERSLMDKYHVSVGGRLLKSKEHCKRAPIMIGNVERGGAVVTYFVTVGPFIAELRMLNLDAQCEMNESSAIGKGAFGVVVPIQDDARELVAKRIKFLHPLPIIPKGEDSWIVVANFTEARGVLVEYGFLKVCSMLKIGPNVPTDIGFDVICYRDCLEYFMEKCEPYPHQVDTLGQEKIATNLKERMGRMHRYHLCHKDIKPANILFSPSLQDYVFCDFGVAATVFEEPG